MRVVLDTNIFISGLRFGGKPELVLLMATQAAFVLIVSEDILSELEDVLLRKFRWSRKNLTATLNGIRTVAEVVRPDLVLSDCEDPDDNRILEAAVTGRASVIVSGDKHLLRMKRFRGIEILSVGNFIARLEDSG